MPKQPQHTNNALKTPRNSKELFVYCQKLRSSGASKGTCKSDQSRCMDCKPSRSGVVALRRLRMSHGVNSLATATCTLKYHVPEKTRIHPPNHNYNTSAPPHMVSIRWRLESLARGRCSLGTRGGSVTALLRLWPPCARHLQIAAEVRQATRGSASKAWCQSTAILE